MSAADAALLALLRRLDALGYDFVAVTPQTHVRVVARDPSPGSNLRDLFGWSRTVDHAAVDPEIVELLTRAGASIDDAAGLRSTVRVSRVGGRLFLHSAFPTEAADAVFLGPDTYRFVRFVAAERRGRPPARSIVDMGAGSGAGGILAALAVPGASLTLIDCNAAALRFAAINAEAAGVAATLLEADNLDALTEPVDLIIANPPYMIDQARRAYRDGGGLLGVERALDWAIAGAGKLSPGGAMLLYSGSPVVDGQAVLTTALADRMAGTGCTVAIAEIDPDVFGEELDQPAYAGVERIAALGIVMRCAGSA